MVEEIASRLFKSLAITPETLGFYCDALQRATGGLIREVAAIDRKLYSIDNSHFIVT